MIPERENAARVQAGGVQETSAHYRLTPVRYFRPQYRGAQALDGKRRSIQMAEVYTFAKELLLKPRSWGPKAPPASVRAFDYLAAHRTLLGAPCNGLSDLDLWRVVLDAKAYMQAAGRWGCVVSLNERRELKSQGVRSGSRTVH